MTTTKTDALMALADAYAIEVAETSPPLTTLERSLAMTKIGDARIALREALLAALQARNQQGPIKTWQQRLEETCPALGPMHIHACVEEVNDAMQAEIAELRSALQEQAREGEAVANSAILARGRFHFFKGENGEPDDWEWFEEGTNCEHGCIDAVIVRADAISAPQPAQPEQVDWKDQYEKQKRRAEMWIAKYEKDIGPLEKVYPAAQPEQGELAGPDQIEKIVDRYVDEYEFTDGENAYHSPNEFEQMLIKDAFYGLLVDEEWDAAWGAHIASLQSAQPVAQPLTVDVCFIDGDDPFICTVHGKITVDALSEIEADIHENPDFGKGDGVYSYNVTRFNGQYGFEGRCELPPGWELDEIGYEPIEAAHGIGGGR